MARTIKSAAPVAPAIDTARPSLTVTVDGVDVTLVKRADPFDVAEGVKVDGRLAARYDSHSRVFGAAFALVPERWTALDAAVPGSDEWKAARARFQFHGVRALTALARALAHRHAADLNSGPAGTRPLVEGKISYSVDAGGKGVAAYVLPRTLRLDGSPVDVFLDVAGDAPETITVAGEPVSGMDAPV